MEVRDIIDLQFWAARYANRRSSYSVSNVNDITERMILAGIMPQIDTIDERKDTVWCEDGDFGLPNALIEKYGHDGRKARVEYKSPH